MSHRDISRHRLHRASMVASVMVVLAVMVASSGTPVQAASPASIAHPYRHGVVPTLGSVLQQPNASGSGPLQYGGGNAGVGVTTGPPKVYVVFWGSQWGSASTNGQGYTTLSGDGNGMAPNLQAFLKGLGTGGETWSGVMTQYCEGVSTGATTCPANAAHVGYPSGGALAGVWADTAAASPSSSTGHQLAVEAVAAATHFGNTSQSSNRNAQYFIVSPTGTTPDGFNTANGNFCAWHDFTADSTLVGGAAASPFGPVAFTNMPYVTDAGSGCGAGFVNGSAGTLDGVTIVGGHEYAETITDQFPNGGWLDGTQNENGDKCAWISSGAQAASRNIALTTGSFAVQSTWSNDIAGCQVSHAIVGPVSNDFSIATAPSSVSVVQGSSISTTVSTTVTSGAAQTVALSATGLPTGATASFNPTSVSAGASSILTITTSASTPAATSTITVTGAGPSASHATTVSLTVTPVVGGPAINNGGFETGNFTGWTTAGASETIVSPGHTGNDAARLGSTVATNGNSSMQQAITVPANANLSFWYQPFCPDTLTYDQQQVQIRNTSGATLASLLNVCDNSGVWKQGSASLAGFAHQTVVLWFNSHDDNYAGDPTYIIFDDISVTTAPINNDFSIAAVPSSVSVVQGSSATTTVSTSVTSGAAQSVTLSATGLPTGASASFNPTNVSAGASSTLTITTSASTPAATSTVTVTGTGPSASHATTVSLTVTQAGGGGVTNGGFETGTLAGWTASGAHSAITTTSHTGTYAAMLGNTTATNGDSTISQTFVASSGATHLGLWYKSTCPDTVTYDWVLVTVRDNTTGITQTVVPKTCATVGWTAKSATVTAGHNYTVTLTSHDDNYGADPTYTLFDDINLS